MANDQKSTTAETALPDGGEPRYSGKPSAEFNALIDWIKEKEAEKIDLRVAYIVTNEEPPFESVHLLYAHPFVKKGLVSGYELADGGFYAKP